MLYEHVVKTFKNKFPERQFEGSVEVFSDVRNTEYPSTDFILSTDSLLVSILAGTAVCSSQPYPILYMQRSQQ